MSPPERDDFRFLVLLRLHAVDAGREGDNSLALDEIAHGVAPSEVRAAVCRLIELGYASWTTSGVRVFITQDGHLHIDEYISAQIRSNTERDTSATSPQVTPLSRYPARTPELLRKAL